MKAHLRAIAVTAVLSLLAACSEPQTPASDGSATSTGAPTGAPTTAAPTDTAAPTTSATATTVPAEKLGAYVLTVKQTGGIAGMQMVTVIDSAAKRITYGGLRNQKPETKELSAEDLATITKAVEESGYQSFPGAIKSPPIADGFTYTLTVKSGREYEVSWGDGANVPEPYSKLQAAANSLRAAIFEGKSPKGAPTK